MLQDFDQDYAFLGFVNSLWVVPPFYVNKEDAVGQEMLNIDFTDLEKESLYQSLNLRP